MFTPLLGAAVVVLALNVSGIVYDTVASLVDKSSLYALAPMSEPLAQIEDERAPADVLEALEEFLRKTFPLAR